MQNRGLTLPNSHSKAIEQICSMEQSLNKNLAFDKVRDVVEHSHFKIINDKYLIPIIHNSAILFEYIPGPFRIIIIHTRELADRCFHKLPDKYTIHKYYYQLY